MEKKVVKSLEEQIVIQKKKLEVLTDNTELFRLLFINKDNKELQGDIVEYIKGKLNERKEKC